MKNDVIGTVISVLFLLCSCDRGHNSHVYETPFPLDEMNAYFDIPFDSVCFVSNNGDTIVLDYEVGEYEYTPHKYHGDDGNGKDNEEYEGDEPETGGQWPESYGIESYFRRGYYRDRSRILLGNDPYITTFIYVDGRASSMVEIDVWPTLESNVDYAEKYTLHKASNDIFNFFKDTLIMSSLQVTDFTTGMMLVPNDKNHVVLVRGKGVVEFSINDNTEIWHIVE